MGNIITGKKLWQNGDFFANGCDINFNCDDLDGGTPVDAWLVPERGCCGETDSMYGMTMQAPSPTKPGTLQGVFVSFKGGGGVLLDAAAVDDIKSACNACCGTVPDAIAGRYNGTFPSTADLVAATYTFTRVDNNTLYDVQRVMLDYMGYAIPGTVTRTGYNSGTSTSTYTFSAYYEPVFRSGDTKTGETSKVFDSNTPPTLGANEELTLDLIADGVQITPTLAGATVAALVTAATGNANYSAKGTYTSNAGKVRLTTTVVNQAQLIVGKRSTV